MFVYKCIFMHDNGATHDLCEEVIVSPYELSKDEAKAILYNKKAYSSNDSVITDLGLHQVFVFDKPFIV